MAFHRKHAAAEALGCDVLIVPECASPAQLEAKGFTVEIDSMIWVGDNRNKGLAIFVRRPYKIEPLFSDVDHLPVWAAPVRISTPSNAKIDMLAVWSFWYRDKRRDASNLVTDALGAFDSCMTSPNLIVAGDFNNSVIWDKGKSTDHRTLSGVLKSRGLVSAYHHYYAQAYGCESAPTIYWRDRTKDGPRYHIDYVYAPRHILDRGFTVDLSDHADWVANGLSDHVPLIVDLPALA